jgi:hypothetical protein
VPISSEDGSAVQQAVDAATSGALIRVAGTCAGVQSRASTTQTVYVSKTVIVRGGYSIADWNTSDPVGQPTVLDAQGGGRVAYITGGGAVTVTLENMTIQGGSMLDSNGGGIYAEGVQLVLSNTIVRDNLTTGYFSVSTGYGGGIFITNTGSVQIYGGQIVNNIGQYGGGLAIWEGSGIIKGSLVQSNTADYGGGLRNRLGPLTIMSTTLSGNQAVGFENNWGGGGIRNTGVITVVNSTFSGNETANGGGAIDQDTIDPNPAGAVLINSTIVSNTATGITETSGIFVEAGPVVVQNSIVAYNDGTHNVYVGSGTFTSQGYNLTNSGTGTVFDQTTDITDTNPLLGPLQNNGGSTWTHALLSGSPAINRIPNGTNGCGTTILADQRGVARPQNSACDVGAYEVEGVYYTLSVNTAGTGSGTIGNVPSGTTFSSGTVVTLTATANTGSTFAGWSGAVTGAANPITLTMNSNKVVTGTFTLNTYLITPTAGLNGSITPGTPQTVNHGASRTFSITANTGYHIVDVGVDGVSQGALPAYTFNNVTANHTISASFAINTYLITPTAGLNGSITPGTPQTVNHGASRTFSITANTGYHIVDVGVDGVSQGALPAYTFNNVTANHTISASFAINTHTLSVNTAGNGSGTIGNAPSGTTFDYGTVVTLTATANTGSTFAGWSGAVTGGTNPITLTMDGDKVVTGTFTLNTHTLSVNTAGNGSGTIGNAPSGTTFDYGTVVTLTATANTGSTFAGWSGAVTGGTNPITLTMDGDKVVTGTFTLNTHTLSVNTAGNGSGTIGNAPSGTTFDYGTVVTLTATANTGSTFTGWSGAVTGATNPITLTMDGDKVVTGTFTLNTYTLEVNVVGSGSVAKTPNQTTYLYGDVVTLTATPEVGWAFNGWSGALLGVTNPATLTITGNSVVTATFVSTCVPVDGVDFVFTPAKPKGGQTVDLTAQLISGTSPITYTWDFGDGSGSVITTTTLVHHIFPVTNTLQTYTTTLTTVNVCSSQAVQKPIAIYPYSVYLPIVLR